MSRMDDISTPHGTVDTLYLTINAPTDGGITIYEAIDGAEPQPKFSGDLAQCVKYLEMRMGKILRTPRNEAEIRAIEARQGIRSFSEIKREASGRIADAIEGA